MPQFVARSECKWGKQQTGQAGHMPNPRACPNRLNPKAGRGCAHRVLRASDLLLSKSKDACEQAATVCHTGSPV